MNERKTCRAVAKSGEPCRSFALAGSEFCLAHDPERVGQLRQSRAKGGAKASQLRALRGRRAKLDTVGGLVRFTAGVIQDALAGTVAADVARVVLYGISIQRQLLEAGDLEKRIAALEANLGRAS